MVIHFLRLASQHCSECQVSFVALCFLSLLQVATASASRDQSNSSWTGHTAMIGIFRNMFGSQSCPHIVKYNDFSNFINYFIQKVSFNDEYPVVQVYFSM